MGHIVNLYLRGRQYRLCLEEIERNIKTFKHEIFKRVQCWPFTLTEVNENFAIDLNGSRNGSKKQ